MLSLSAVPLFILRSALRRWGLLSVEMTSADVARGILETRPLRDTMIAT